MIKIENLGVHFDSIHGWLFRNINLKIHPKETIVIAGPSGSGKSVLLKTIARLIVPTEGKVHLESENIGMLFQKNALFDSLTVIENLTFPLREKTQTPRKEALKKAKYFLKEIGLADSENLYPDEISGGMQKRLGIARSLIVEPEIILYDEPTSGLDPITSRRIADLIVRLKDDLGTTVLMVTNDMRRAYQLGDQIHILAKGSLYKGGTPETVQSSNDPLIKQFVRGLEEGPLTERLDL